MYHHLFLDLDGTLMDFNEAEKRAFTLMAELLNIPINTDAHHLYAECNLACWKEFEQGLLTIEELTIKRYLLFKERSGLEFDPIQASKVYEEQLSQQGILYPQTIELLTSLKEKGYRLHLASNGISAVQRGRLAVTHLSNYFEHIFISTEMGVQKPDPRFFDHMLTITGAKKEECLMVGDSLSSDIQGAIDSGIDSLWLNPTNQQTALKPTYTVASLKELQALLLSIT